MSGAVPSIRLGLRSAAFLRAAARYWLRVFPLVAGELRRRRELALGIPDPVLRRMALQALECKRCNVEGAAAFELLARGFPRRALVRALAACQSMCDYLDLLAEQPCSDPVANGRALHQALIVALTPGELHCDYYAHQPHRDDGGYLKTLVEDVQATVARLPALACVQEALCRSAERIAAYQSFNHGDACGSYADFENWAIAESSPDDGLSWWEVGAGAGSTLTAFALIASATDRRLAPAQAAAIEALYFPWLGALHSLLDSLVDEHEDVLAGERGLIGCYRSAEHAATRMHAIASEALARVQAMPGDRRHGLLAIAMVAFYLCDARSLPGEHARLAAPALIEVAGGLARLAVLMMTLRRRTARHSRAESALLVAAK